MIFKKYSFLFLLAVASLLSFNVAFADVGDMPESCVRWMSENPGWGEGMMGYGNMMNWGDRGVMGGGWGILTMILTLVFWLVFWAVAIVVIIALARWIYRKAFKGELMILGKKETSDDIVKMRYAKGELTKEQYEAIREEIGK